MVANGDNEAGLAVPRGDIIRPTAYREQGPAEIERLPWSVLGPEFVSVWGRADPSNPQPEHMEVTGMNGSGKTYFILTIVQERMIVRDTPTVIICTKPDDQTLYLLGWPIVDSYEGVRKHRQCIFWPRTQKLGAERKAYHNAKIYELLDRLWVPKSNRLIVFDEIAYIESLSPELRDMIEMYWRESRALGITMVAGKQRIQGANRHMSSETWWTIAFVPKDEADKERIAELFGPRRVWLPVFQEMDPFNHEFLIRHTKSGVAYVSYVDTPLRPVEPPDESRGSSMIYTK
ncbi:MAG TPA: hypothetical protein VN861_14695 [Candidatus Acidoferrales bacterium]|nr:hypothetical protein [Candidatus Acidoferrales bacterium]